MILGDAEQMQAVGILFTTRLLLVGGSYHHLSVSSTTAIPLCVISSSFVVILIWHIVLWMCIPSYLSIKYLLPSWWCCLCATHVCNLKAAYHMSVSHTQSSSFCIFSVTRQDRTFITSWNVFWLLLLCLSVFPKHHLQSTTCHLEILSRINLIGKNCNIKYNFSELSLFSHLQTRIIRLSCLASRTNFHHCVFFSEFSVSVCLSSDSISSTLSYAIFAQIVSIQGHMSVLSGEPHNLSLL